MDVHRKQWRVLSAQARAARGRARQPHGSGEPAGSRGAAASASAVARFDTPPLCRPPRSPVYGLIFLFKWRHEKDDRPIDRSPAAADVFFANQVRRKLLETRCAM